MATETHIPATSSVTADHFEAFGLPRKLNVDVAALQKEFYRRSREHHPDNFASASPEQQAWSTEQTSRLNDAFRTLKDPIARTRHLLELEGVQLEEQSSAATHAARASGEAKKQVVPPELLEEVFELNMQLQELRMGEDDPQVVSDLRAAQQKFEAMLDGIGAELQQLWNAWDSAQTDTDRAEARDQMVALLNRRNYVRNLVRDVNEALEGK